MKFSYTAKAKSGKTVSGVVEAATKSDVASLLSESNLQALVINEAKSSRNFDIKLGSKKVKTKEKVIFTRQLSTMVNAGVPLVRSLATLQNQVESEEFKRVISEVAKQVQSGISLGDSLAEHPKVFSSVYINMVRAGETGGILDEILDRLATQQEKDASIRGKIKSAMTYPAVIVTVTVGAFFFLMTSIVPRLGAIIKDLGGDQPLPIYTEIMLSISDVLTNNILTILIGTAAVIFGLIRYFRTKKGRRQLHKIMLKIPLFGQVVLKVNLARFARTFGTLMASGVSVLDSLRVTTEALTNSIVQDELTELAKKVKNGSSISEPLLESDIFPQILGQMMAVGEETGQIDEVLIKLADFYEEEVDRFVSSISSIIEPIMIVVLGAMVGLIVASVFAPLSSISTAV